MFTDTVRRLIFGVTILAAFMVSRRHACATDMEGGVQIDIYLPMPTDPIPVDTQATGVAYAYPAEPDYQQELAPGCVSYDWELGSQPGYYDVTFKDTRDGSSYDDYYGCAWLGRDFLDSETVPEGLYDSPYSYPFTYVNITPPYGAYWHIPVYAWIDLDYWQGDTYIDTFYGVGGPASFDVTALQLIAILQNGLALPASPSIIVGQMADLSAQVAPPDTGALYYKWLIDGAAVYQYAVDPPSTPGTNPTSAEADFIVPHEFPESQIAQFYWSQGGSRNVQCILTVGGVEQTASTTFTVQTPTYGSGTLTQGTISVQNGYKAPGDTWLCYGNVNDPGNLGVEWNLSYSNLLGGITEDIQLASMHVRYRVDVFLGIIFAWYDVVGNGLDTTYPYGATDDSPCCNLSDLQSTFNADKVYYWIEADDYDMYQPPAITSGRPSIWVPVKEWGWFFNAGAILSGSSWTVAPDPAVPGLPPEGYFPIRDATGFPEWSSNCRVVTVTQE